VLCLGVRILISVFVTVLLDLFYMKTPNILKFSVIFGSLIRQAIEM